MLINHLSNTLEGYRYTVKAHLPFTERLRRTWLQNYLSPSSWA
ncbi:MAG: hypothetical protein QNJ63_20890 [Calothrix sp. MO_192.B10]|nr:hypothetical protein [Calothrix sp. MO_192.B10]